MKFICTICFFFSISDFWCDALRDRNDYQRQWRDMNMHQSGSNGRNRDRFPNDMLRDAPTRRNGMLRDAPTRRNWNEQAPQLDELLDEDELNNIGKMESRHPINQRDQIRFPSNQRQDIRYPANQHDELRFPTNQRDEFQYPMNQGDDGLNSRRHDYYQGPVPFARDYYNNQGKNYRRAYPYQDFSTVKDEKPHRFYPFDKVLSDASEQLKRHGQPLNTLKDLSRVMGDHGLPNPNSRKYHNDFLENPEETDNEDQSEKQEDGAYHTLPIMPSNGSATMPPLPKIPFPTYAPIPHPFIPGTSNSSMSELFNIPKNITGTAEFRRWYMNRQVTFQSTKIKQLHQLIIQLLYMDESLWTSFSSDHNATFTGGDSSKNELLKLWLYNQRLQYQKKKVKQLKLLAIHLIHIDFGFTVFN